MFVHFSWLGSRFTMHNPARVAFYSAFFVFVVVELAIWLFEPSCLSLRCLNLDLGGSVFQGISLIARTDRTNTSHLVSPSVSPEDLAVEDITHSVLSGTELAVLTKRRCREVYGNKTPPINRGFPFENRVFLAHQEKLAYCAIAKAFSSNIKRIMLYLSHRGHSAQELEQDMSGVNSIIYPHQLNFWRNNTVLKNLPEDQRGEVFESYYRFVIVRDPVLKAISAYRDKFYSSTEDVFHQYFRKTTGTIICNDMVNYLKDNHSKAPASLKTAKIDCAQRPAYFDLQSFLAWSILVPDSEKPPSHAKEFENPHWAPSIPICRICDPQTQYNFIGHFENGAMGLAELFEVAGWKFPLPAVSDTTISEVDKERFVKEVESLPQEFIKELNEAFAVERYILGYTNEKPGSLT